MIDSIYYINLLHAGRILVPFNDSCASGKTFHGAAHAARNSSLRSKSRDPHSRQGQILKNMYTYSAEVPHTATSESSAIRRSYKAALIGHTAFEGCKTLFELFERAVTLHTDSACLGERYIDSIGNITPFLFKSYGEVRNMVVNLASGLEKEGLMAPTSDGNRFLGICMQNCTDWIVSEQACYYLGAATVPMYETLNASTMDFVASQCELQTIVCSPKSVEAVLAGVGHSRTVRNIIISDVGERILNEKLNSLRASFKSMTFYRFEDVLNIGSAYPFPPLPPLPSTLATLCYTSGTTGNPKGAMITHGNLVAAATSGLEGCIRAGPSDVYLSFLPLPHIFERLVINALLSSGCSVGLFRGNPLFIIDDTKSLEPTIFCAVPRLLNRIYDKVMAGATADPKSMATKLFTTGLATKIQQLRETGSRDHWLWDRLIFRKLRTALGLRRCGRLLSGGAPLSKEVMEFYRVMLGGQCHCHEGYGQTETSGGTTMTAEEDTRTVGHVGSPFPAVEIKLVDVLDMGYLHTDTVHGGLPCVGRGEIWVRGSVVFQGYYKDEEATRAALTSDGWLRSGDVGIFLPEGQLKIVDRIKNIMKLAQGEFVAVEKIEGLLGQAPLVASIFVHGVSTESSLVAVVVVDEEAYMASSPSSLPLAQALQDEPARLQLTQRLLTQMEEVGRRAGLKGFELVKAVHIESQPWTPEDAEPVLTPTFKLQRAKAKARYKDALSGLFNELKMQRAKL